jgi:hypothetical protein
MPVHNTNITPPRYRCDAGHEVYGNGTWTTLEVQMSGETEPTRYIYCRHCIGAWAASQWPLRELVPVKD